MKKTEIIVLVLVLIAFAVGFYFYPILPEKVASHWNQQGQVNGHINKFWGAFLMPVVALAMFFMFLIIPRIDPMKENIKKFRKYFDGFIILITLFLLYIYALTILQNTGTNFNMSQAMIPALAVLLFYCGVLIKKSKRNWFVGIRTPWTLSSDIVWDKTHKIGGKLFKTAGVISLLGIFYPDYAMWFILIPIISFVTFTFVYSYIEYRKLQKVN